MVVGRCVRHKGLRSILAKGGPEWDLSYEWCGAERMGPELRAGAEQNEWDLSYERCGAERMEPELRVTFIGACNVAQVPLRPLVAVTDLRPSIVRFSR
jgi:hypothetical protein